MSESAVSAKTQLSLVWRETGAVRNARPSRGQAASTRKRTQWEERCVATKACCQTQKYLQIGAVSAEISANAATLFANGGARRVLEKLRRGPTSRAGLCCL